MAVPPDVFVEVALEPLLGNVTVTTANPVFHDGPETLDGVRVNVPDYVAAIAVVDLPVVEHLVLHGVVAEVRVCVDGGPGRNVLTEAPDQIGRRSVRDRVGACSAPTLDHAENGLLLVTRATPPTSVPTVPIVAGIIWGSATGLSANVRFVSFDRSDQHRVVIDHQLVTNLGEHAPSRLVSDSKLALQLLGRDAHTGLSHQEDGVEPKLERRGRLVHDRVGGWVNVVTAHVARVRGAARNAMELAYLATLGAVGVLGVHRGVVTLPEVGQAGRIVWEVPHEIHDGVGRSAARSLFWLIPVHWSHVGTLP